MNTKFASIIIAGVLMSSFSLTSMGVTPKKKAIDSANMDFSVNPGDDFYRYSNGGWLKRNPIPAEYSRYGAFEVLLEENLKQLRGIMEEAAKDKTAPKGSLKQKVGDFYAMGMDTAKIEADGIKPLLPEIERIKNIKTTDDVIKQIAHMHTMGMYTGFEIYSTQDAKNSTMMIAEMFQGGLGLPDQEYYTLNDSESKNLKEQYKEHISNLLILIGKDAKTAHKAAQSILDFETRLAKSSKSMTELRNPIANYNKITRDQLQKLTPDWNWNTYFIALGYPEIKEMNVGQPLFYSEFGRMLKEENIETWKNYLTWHLIHNTASYLSTPFVNENFNFYGKILTGKTKMSVRWKKVLNQTSSSLGEIVGQIYVEKYFPAEAKTRMIELVNNLKFAFENRINNLEWMSSATKQKAVEKLKAIGVKIGYPDKWKDYSSLEISRESYLQNVINTDKFAFAEDMKKVGKPVDRTEWGMTPQTINAYYSPNMNEIVFPAAFLQPPFFFLDADDAVNYAAIGTVIGHEMTHGFDDQGRLFDKDGNLTDWWTKVDSTKFVEYTSPLVTQFNNFVMLDSVHVNGEMTLGENIADLGGITISYEAFKRANQRPEPIDGFTPDQRFFLSYGQIWCSNIRDKQQLMLIKTDVHSPAEARVNQMLYNLPMFYDAFNIKSGKRFIPAEKRVVIW